MKDHRENHGMSKNRLYRIWSGIKTRCLNKNNPAYYRYGGRGITICDDWLKFENFRDDMYLKYIQHVGEHGVKNTSIDRIDNDKGYSPDNCRWATPSIQANNQRFKGVVKQRSNGGEMSDGETKMLNIWHEAILNYEAGGTVIESCKMIGVTPASFNRRLEVLSAAGVLKRKPRPSTFLQNLINKLR